MEIVAALRAKLKERLGAHRYELWFAATSLRIDHGELVLDSSNTFYRDWLRTHFRKDVETVCCEVLGRSVAVRFHVDPNVTSRLDGSDSDTSGPPSLIADTRDRRTGHTAAAERPTRPAPGPAPGRPRRRYLKLSQFVEGDSNKLAYMSAQMAVRRPGKVSPLLIYGPTGSGKSHLLEGVYAETRNSRHGARAMYMTAERFTSHFLEALGGRGLPSFRQKYRGLDLLLIDDIQFFAGKKATRVELLHTVDTLLSMGRQLVFSSDRPPSDLSSLGADLVTRLKGGLVCHLEPPDYATRVGIVAGMCRELDVEFPENVQLLVASRASADARELSGVLNRIQLQSLAHDQPVTRAMAEAVLSAHLHESSRPVRLLDVEKAVCELFGVGPDSLRSRCNSDGVSQPRILAMWLARKHTRAALSEIGHFFGRKSHSSVISAQKKVQRWMDGHQHVIVGQNRFEVEEAIRRAESLMRIA